MMVGGFIEQPKAFAYYIQEIAEYIGIHKDELLNGCQKHYNLNALSANDLLIIAQNLQVDPILLWKKELDLNRLKNFRAGNNILPTCYTEVSNSNIASIKNLLNEFKKYGLYEYALKKIQIDEATLNTNNTISVLAVDELFNYSRNIFTKKDYIKIATGNAEFLYQNALKKEVSSTSSKIKKATTMVELVSHFERNWNYTILRTDLNTITLRNCESEEMRSTKSYKTYTNDITNLCRFTFVQEALSKLGIMNTSVVPTSDWNNEAKSFTMNINLQ